MNRDACNTIANKLKTHVCQGLEFNQDFDKLEPIGDNDGNPIGHTGDFACYIVAAHFEMTSSQQLLDFHDEFDIDSSAETILGLWGVVQQGGMERVQAELSHPNYRYVDVRSLNLEDCILVLRHAAKTGEIRWDLTGKTKEPSSRGAR